MFVLYLYLILINAVGLSLMLADKRRAIKKQWRIPESTLFGVAAIGGSMGILLGMRLFHHKTKRTSFSDGIPVILAIQIVLVVILCNTTK